jgi:hypothetical protein
LQILGAVSALVQPKMLARLASAILVLNLVDAILTLFLVTAGLAVEANPLMETALSQSPLAFMAAKLSLVSLGILFLYRMRQHRFAAGAIVASVIVYGGVVAYHLSGLAA